MLVNKLCICFFVLFLGHFSFISHSALNDLTQHQKDKLVSCMTYLYLNKVGIQCADTENNLDKVYDKAKTYFLKNHPGESLPEAYTTKETFEKLIGKQCIDGAAVCKDFKDKTDVKRKLRRRKCDEYFSKRTCKNNPFTYIAAVVFNKSNICPDSTVKNCISVSKEPLVKLLIKLGLDPSLADDVEKNWPEMFFTLAKEKATGKTLLYRAAQATVAAAAVGAVVSVGYVAAPALAATALHLAAIKTVGKIKDTVLDKSKEKAAEYAKKLISSGIETVEVIKGGCICQCPKTKA